MLNVLWLDEGDYSVGEGEVDGQKILFTHSTDPVILKAARWNNILVSTTADAHPDWFEWAIRYALVNPPSEGFRLRIECNHFGIYWAEEVNIFDIYREGWLLRR